MKKILMLVLMVIAVNLFSVSSYGKTDDSAINYAKTYPVECSSGKKVKVRITVYWADGGETDDWSSSMESSTGEKLRDRQTCAVDPRIFPYYSKIYIPDLDKTVVAIDTGTAVLKKKASHGRYPVIDVFFKRKRDAERFEKNADEIATVTVM